MHAYSNYIGGWDGTTIAADTPEKLYQSQLIYPKNIIEPPILKFKPTIADMKRTPGNSDNPVHLGSYEYGPGYALPSGTKPFVLEAEKIGKSLALGVATLDTTMIYLLNGFDAPLCYFKFGGGYNFNTHLDINFQKPIPAYLALKMRNLYTNGDLMEVESRAVKTIDMPEMMGYKRRKTDKYDERIIKAVSGIEMTSCYTFEDEKTYSIMILSRNVDENRKTKLSLPVEVEGNAKLYKLTGKPWDTNLDEQNVIIQEENISDYSSNYTFIMPASSVYIFVVNKK